jgi:P-type conjugative transfer protein TrbJ
MSTPRSTRRRILLCVLGACCSLVSPVRADLFGGDVAVLAAILEQTITQVSQFATQIDQLQAQIRLTHTLLHGIERGDVLSLLQFLRQATLTLSSLVRGVNAIGYRMKAIDLEYNAVYGQSVRGTPPSEFNGMHARWQSEILGSTQVAMRAQTNLESLEDHAKATKKLVDSSTKADGVVAQLQIVVQMLALLDQDLLSLQRTLDTGSRVVASVAASGASEKQLVQERKRLNLENYTDRGAPAPVADSLR